MHIKSINLEKQRMGTIRKNNSGSIMEIIKYINTSNVWVKFEQGKPVHTSWGSFCKGEVKNVYDKSIYGVGYFGEGEYKSSTKGKPTKIYRTWQCMLQRCYDKKCQEKHPTYIGCTVTEEWYNFQNFAKWWENNYYEVDGKRMHLDKDILIRSNKVYSPETCMFVPQRINCLFTKRDADRGSLPIGVQFYKDTGRYISFCRNKMGKKECLGYYTTVEQAFQSYKSYKEKLIKSIADDYKERIPDSLYKAMIKYEVDIND